MEFGIQMYSLRDITKDDLEGALKKVAQQGYKLIEFAGFFGHSAEEVKGMLDKYGLKVSGTHSSLQDLVDNYEETVAYHKALGNKEYIIPHWDFSTKEKADDFVKYVNEIQPKLKEEGIRLSYHNHSHEFRDDCGFLPYDIITKETSINLEIDTFWAYAAGKDPVALMEEYKDRLTFIHIKDGFADGKGMPLGKGTAPVPAVFEKAKAMGIPMVVESETLTPSGEEEARICIECLKELEKR